MLPILLMASEHAPRHGDLAPAGAADVGGVVNLAWRLAAVAARAAARGGKRRGWNASIRGLHLHLDLGLRRQGCHMGLLELGGGDVGGVNGLGDDGNHFSKDDGREVERPIFLHGNAHGNNASKHCRLWGKFGVCCARRAHASRTQGTRGRTRQSWTAMDFPSPSTLPVIYTPLDQALGRDHEHTH